MFVRFCVLALFAWSMPAQSACPKNPLKGYKFLRHSGGEDVYAGINKAITLRIKCFSRSTRFDDVVNKLKTESNEKLMRGDAVFFDVTARGRHKRIYVINGNPVYQMTFITRYRYRALLEPTQAQVEAYLEKKKK